MSASTASFSSGPSAMRLMEVPFTIPRESTPSRLLAFTRRSSFSTQMELLNSLAFWMKNVAGLACRPTWLFTTASFIYIAFSPQRCIRILRTIG